MIYMCKYCENSLCTCKHLEDVCKVEDISEGQETCKASRSSTALAYLNLHVSTGGLGYTLYELLF